MSESDVREIKAALKEIDGKLDAVVLAGQDMKTWRESLEVRCTERLAMIQRVDNRSEADHDRITRGLSWQQISASLISGLVAAASAWAAFSAAGCHP